MTFAARVPIGIAVSGEQSCKLAGRKAEIMAATEPKPELVESFEAAGGAGKPRVGQVALVQIGGEHQREFIAWAEQQLLPPLRSL